MYTCFFIRINWNYYRGGSWCGVSIKARYSFEPIAGFSLLLFSSFDDYCDYVDAEDAARNVLVFYRDWNCYNKHFVTMRSFVRTSSFRYLWRVLVRDYYCWIAFSPSLSASVELFSSSVHEWCREHRATRRIIEIIIVISSPLHYSNVSQALVLLFWWVNINFLILMSLRRWIHSELSRIVSRLVIFNVYRLIEIWFSSFWLFLYHAFLSFFLNILKNI